MPDGAIARREFFQIAGVGAAAAMTIGCGRKPGAVGHNAEIPTTCELCPNKCSVIAVVRDGLIRKLNPNPENPKSRGMLCARGNAGLLQVYDPNRLKQPLIRAGARGEGKWCAASWDEAFDYTAQKLAGIKEKYGPQGVLWSSTEAFAEVFFKNLGLAFGSPNIVRHPTLCLASVNLAYSITFGTVPSFDLLNANYVIMAGANRFEAFITPDTMHLIESTMNRKTRLVVLDPRFTVTAAKADQWYPLKPGSDLAFILAMLHVITGEGRQDKEFVTAYCHGYEELAEHVKPYTPEWAEAETGIPAKEIARIAREFSDAAPRAVFYAGRRSSWYRNDFQMRRAQAILNAIVGNWDRQGGMVPNAKIALGEYLFLPWDDPQAPRVDEMEKNFPLAAQGDGAYLQLRDNVLAGMPYPVKGWMVLKQDPMSALPEQAKTLRMIEQMEFIAAIDIQMSDTAWYADVVFPESTYLERQDPIEVLSGIWPVAVLRQPAVKPVYDTRPCLEIVQGLAKRLGLEQYFDYTIEQWNDAAARELPIRERLRLSPETRRIHATRRAEIRQYPHGRPPLRDQVRKDRAVFGAVAGNRPRSPSGLSGGARATRGALPSGVGPQGVLYPCQYYGQSMAAGLRPGESPVDESRLRAQRGGERRRPGGSLEPRREGPPAGQGHAGDPPRLCVYAAWVRQAVGMADANP